MEDTKRTRRTREEIVSDIDKKISYHKEKIVALELKKENVLNPKTRKKSLTVKRVLEIAKSEGMTPEDIAERLGLNIENI